MKHFLLFILSLTIHTAIAQSIAKEKAFTSRPLTFIENKGQVTDQYGNARHDIQYKVAGKGMSVFIGNGQLHYQFSKANPKPLKGLSLINKNKYLPFRGRGLDTTPTRYAMYRLDMKLQGANPHPQVIAEDKQPYYENYHTVALHTDSTVVSAYNKITYKNIYPHIDWVLYIKDKKLEYDFIVHPGGDVNNIKIKYNGATNIADKDGSIKIKTPFGDVSERNLYAYEQTTGKNVAANFTLHNNTVAFSLPTAYSSRRSSQGMKQTTLVIDPTLAWGTYYGGNGEDVAMGTACDSYGNVFITGRTSSISNIATIGSYQVIFGGYEDVFLAKFNAANGAIQWATYYGGNDQDNGYSVACDNVGNSYITGFTVSGNNIATPGAYQTVYQGGWDAYLAKFNSSGAIQWSTYFGGSKTDQGWSVACDATGNAYISGVTSSNNSVATTGSYQDTIGGIDSTNNAFLAKFSTNGTLIWGTYFGGGGDGDAAFACTCDNANNIYITGTVEGNTIHTTPGCYQDSCWDGRDCFIAKFDSACNLKWSTYYGGDEGELAQGIACDDSLNVYITGVTYSISGIATVGANQIIYGGGSNDAFLAKFNDTGAIQWATYYGGLNDDEGTTVACDHNRHIYITGYTNSTNNIATPGSYYDTYQGGSDDAYLAKFANTGLLLWATYYGGSLGDGAYGIACDAMNNVYITGGTASPNNIATSGVFQSIFADETDAFLAKFDTGTTSLIKIISRIKSLNLYPNPNNGNFEISGEVANALSCDNTANIQILNALGDAVYNAGTILQNGQLNEKINLQGLPAGLYLMRLDIAGESESKIVKFAIQY